MCGYSDEGVEGCGSRCSVRDRGTRREERGECGGEFREEVGVLDDFVEEVGVGVCVGREEDVARADGEGEDG